VISDKRLISYDPLTGLETYHSYDDLEDKTIISYESDPTPVLEVNKKLQNNTDYSKDGIKDEFWHFASIPVQVQMDWLINFGVDIYKKDDAQKVFKLLNDPDYLYLKTTTGKHYAKQ